MIPKFWNQGLIVVETKKLKETFNTSFFYGSLVWYLVLISSLNKMQVADLVLVYTFYKEI